MQHVIVILEPGPGRDGICSQTSAAIRSQFGMGLARCHPTVRDPGNRPTVPAHVSPHSRQRSSTTKHALHLDGLQTKYLQRQESHPCAGSILTAVVFCTGGGGTICSVQVKALVALGANAAILGRRQPTVCSLPPSFCVPIWECGRGLSVGDGKRN